EAGNGNSKAQFGDRQKKKEREERKGVRYDARDDQPAGDEKTEHPAHHGRGELRDGAVLRHRSSVQQIAQAPGHYRDCNVQPLHCGSPLSLRMVSGVVLETSSTPNEVKTIPVQRKPDTASRSSVKPSSALRMFAPAVA